MIIKFCEAVIADLGATGLLVLGLFFVIGLPLKTIAVHIREINHELGEIITMLKIMDGRENR